MVVFVLFSFCVFCFCFIFACNPVTCTENCAGVLSISIRDVRDVQLTSKQKTKKQKKALEKSAQRSNQLVQKSINDSVRKGTTDHVLLTSSKHMRRLFSHSEHHFPAPSPKLCQIYLRLRKVRELIRLWKQPSAQTRTLT